MRTATVRATGTGGLRQPAFECDAASVCGDTDWCKPGWSIQETQATLHLPYGKSEVIIGRDDPVSNLFPDIDLTDAGGDRLGVSRQHARIFFQGNQAFVEDRNSTNHTYVNGEKLLPWQPHPLQSGDEIQFGHLKTNFYL